MDQIYRQHFKSALQTIVILMLTGISLTLLSGCDQSSRQIKDLQQEVWQNPDNPEAYIKLGTAHARQQQYDAAVDAYEKALSLDPDSGERVFPVLGAIAFNREEYEKALDYFRKSLEFSPEDSLRFYDMGNVYLKLERNEEAIDAYTRAIENSISFEEAYYNLAISYIRNDQKTEAEKIYAWLQERNNYLSVSLERHLFPDR